ncbi:MAG: ECF transporter S component [Christensenellaceae bacterium]|nr:ECF transporter S component [Christensenellaceae bacterium]
MQNKNKALYSLVFTALLSALVFASNYISFPIGQSRIHVANAVCLLASMLLGPVNGGIAAGLGSALFDLSFPAYAAEWWITFINKAAMAIVCGAIMHRVEKPSKKLIYVSAAVGSITYMVLYLFKSFIQMRFIAPVPASTIGPTLLTMLGASLTNAIFAVLVAPLVYMALEPALRASNILYSKPPKE